MNTDKVCMNRRAFLKLFVVAITMPFVRKLKLQSVPEQNDVWLPLVQKSTNDVLPVVSVIAGTSVFGDWIFPLTFIGILNTMEQSDLRSATINYLDRVVNKI